MEKRLLLAIALASVVIFAWSALIPKPQPIANKDVTEEKIITPSSVPAITAAIPQINAAAPDQLTTLSTDSFEIIFNDRLAAIKEAVFKDHQPHKFPLRYGFWIADNNLVFQKQNISANSATFVYSDKDKKIIKRFNFSNYSYNIELEIEVQNLSNTLLSFDLPLVLGVMDFNVDPEDPERVRFQDLSIATDDRLQHFNGRKDIKLDRAKFIGLRDKYFCSILGPVVKDGYTAWVKKIDSHAAEAGLKSPQLNLSPGQTAKEKFGIYFGPQDVRNIKLVNSEWTGVVNYGFFDFIAQILIAILKFFYRVTHNWGWAIILLTIVIQVLLYPLSLKQMRSMKEMQILQPKIADLKKKYGDNPQKLNKEILDLYRQHKVNPFGGCLPLILQMPIFIALYQVQTRFFPFKNAAFLWIKDLSMPDRLIQASKLTFLPGRGIDINILPILMAVILFFQQRNSLAKASGEAAEQQKIMVIMLPVMLLFFLYNASSGFNLYLFLNNAFMLLYQVHINKKNEA